MSIAGVLEQLSGAILLLSMAYLAWRTLRQVISQQRSYAALPFADIGDIGSEDSFADKARAAMLGVALGDALGMPREMLPVWLANLRFGRAPGLSRGIVRFMRRRGTISDDTQLTVATARAIDDQGEYRPEVFRAALVEWTSYAIGPGAATMQAAKGLAKGLDLRDHRSQGNGAAMRVVPLAIAYRHDIERFLKTLRVDAEQTHPNPEAIGGAEAMGRLIIYLLGLGEDDKMAPETLIEAMLPRRYSQEIEEWERRLRKAVHKADDEAGLQTIGTSGWVKETVPAVIYLLASEGASIDAGLRRLFDAGGDIDTIAALYLAAVGAWKGTEVFPRELLAAVQGARVLVREASRLQALAARH